MESELFGHERGSFTGADRAPQGLLRAANGGTLFLDEITEMPIELQVKLLRVLETGTFARVGGEQPQSRSTSASSPRPTATCSRRSTQGKLREDLYYRLNVFQISLPPLRERPRRRAAPRAGVSRGPRFDPRDVRSASPTRRSTMLAQYRWPGNVRELRNVVHFAYILAEDSDRRRQPSGRSAARRPSAEPQARPRARPDRGTFTVRVGSTIAEVERRLISRRCANIRKTSRSPQTSSASA